MIKYMFAQLNGPKCKGYKSSIKWERIVMRYIALVRIGCHRLDQHPSASKPFYPSLDLRKNCRNRVRQKVLSVWHLLRKNHTSQECGNFLQDENSFSLVPHIFSKSWDSFPFERLNSRSYRQRLSDKKITFANDHNYFWKYICPLGFSWSPLGCKMTS